MQEMRLGVFEGVGIDCPIVGDDAFSHGIDVELEFGLLLDDEFFSLHGIPHVAALTALPVLVVDDLDQLLLLRGAFRQPAIVVDDQPLPALSLLVQLGLEAVSLLLQLLQIGLEGVDLSAFLL